MANTTISNNSLLLYPPLLLPRRYCWIVIGGTLDIVLTMFILSLGGHEANPLAEAMLLTHGPTGMITYKYLLVLLAIIGCEFVARRKLNIARVLSTILILIHFAPVVWSCGLLITLTQFSASPLT